MPHQNQINEKKGHKDIVDYISRLSPVAWQHINLNGEYAFDSNQTDIDLGMTLSEVEGLEGETLGKVA